MDEFARGSEAKLRVLFVVAGVGQIKRIAEFLQARILDAAVFFVIGLRREHRFGSSREVDPVRTLGVAEARSARGVLRAIEHDDVFSRIPGRILGLNQCNRRIERARRLPARPLRREDRYLRRAMPFAKGNIRGLLREGKCGGER
jgi:hypothetical protein